MEQIKKICNSYKKMDYKEFQILVPMYKTLNGIDTINEKIKSIYNPKSKDKKEMIDTMKKKTNYNNSNQRKYDNLDNLYANN